MTKYRIKEVSSKCYENGVEHIEKKYIIQYKQCFIWQNYVFEYCDNGDTIYRTEHNRFDNMDEAIKVANKIKSLYRGKYKGCNIREMYNDVFICLNFNFCHDIMFKLPHYYTYKSLQEIKDAIDSRISKKKVEYINI